MKNYTNNKGFTLIELLMVVAIIGILTTIVTVSTNTSRTNSKVAATKKTLSSLKGAVGLCCANQDNSLNPAGLGGDEVCSTPINALLPTIKDLNLGNGGSVNYVGTQCNVTDPSFSVNISGHAKPECNGTWTVIENLVTPPTGC